MYSVKNRLLDNNTFPSSFDIKISRDSSSIEIHEHNIGGLSVSADMDNILNALRDEGIDLQGKEILFRDRNGLWENVIVADFEILGARFSKL